MINAGLDNLSPPASLRSSQLLTESPQLDQQQFSSAASVPLPFWTDSDDMLQFLTSDLPHGWPGIMPGVQFQLPGFGSSSELIPGLQGNFHDQNAQGHQAMHQMTTLISTSSFNLTEEVQNMGITSSFLDTCLHVFFDKFIPTFPVLHKATFNVRESSHPLLLNIMALGSLFVGAKDAVPKGEALWRLAHIAVATNWKHLMAVKGPRDPCDGVQLLLTAVLGQTYALMSKNESLRLTCQTFHGLGLAWARQCGMFSTSHSKSTVPPLSAPEEEKVESWKTWAALEVRNRSVLGHYVLDGHISHFSGYPACYRHTTNPFPLPASDAAFEATTADAWIGEMSGQDTIKTSFREAFLSVFSLKPPLATNITLSNFALRIILEGLRSLVAEAHEVEGTTAIGTPVKSDIIGALLRFYHHHLESSDASVDRMELLIRWHSICIDIAAPSTALYRQICSKYGIQQSLHSPIRQDLTGLDLVSWSQSPDGLRALLHATAIQEIVEAMPLRRLHAIHLPSAIFSVATIYSARCLAGIHSISVPRNVRWEALWDVKIADTSHVKNARDIALQDFLHARHSVFNGFNSHTKNLMYELNSLQVTLSSISSRWGVSYEMDDVLQKWMCIANGASPGS